MTIRLIFSLLTHKSFETIRSFDSRPCDIFAFWFSNFPLTIAKIYVYNSGAGELEVEPQELRGVHVGLIHIHPLDRGGFRILAQAGGPGLF